MSLDSISFSQSSLFVSDKKADKKSPIDHNIRDLEFGTSLLADTATNSNRSQYQSKEVVLNDGKSFRLEPKQKKEPLDIESLVQGDSYMNIDELFNRVEHRKVLRESSRKIKAAEGQEKQKKNKKGSWGSLWTESYRPSTFVQLCSAGNDKQYRLILHWLKKWSGVVFGEEVNASDAVDPLGRPHRKILLLHGPTGIGKTVAAQVLAQQLGYSVQELNAANSMDTLPQSSSSGVSGYSNVSKALRLKIMNALTSNTIDSNGKPTCLVIDEIDSSMNSGDIIRVLNDLVQQDQRTMNRKHFRNNMTDEEIDKNKNKAKDFILNRPIICIANDIYSSNTTRGSTMDKLRPLCDIIALKKPTYTKNASGIKSSGNALRSVKDHLMRINEIERIGLDYQEIGEIVEVCDADIRASINYLQLNGRKVDLPECFQDSNKSDKYNMDSQLSWFAMVDLLFKRYHHLSKDENFDKLFDSLMNGSGKSAISSGSVFDKVLKGCFNRYLDVVHYQDDSLVRPSEFSDWLSFYDNTNSNSSQSNVDYYASLVGMKIWSLFSEIDHNKFRREESLIPNAKNLDFEAYELLKQNTTIIRRIMDKIPIGTKLALGGSLDSHGSAAYIIPYLDMLISHNVGPSSSSNITDFDKSSIKKVAQLIKSFDMRLENHRDLETNQISLQISPDWSTITNFDNIMAPVPASVIQKQLQVKRQWLFPLIKAELERVYITKRAMKRPLNTKQTSPEKEEKRVKLSSSIEFFKGKYDGINTQIRDSTARAENHEATRIWVKYHEGFSNAVRKNIGWSDLWA